MVIAHIYFPSPNNELHVCIYTLSLKIGMIQCARFGRCIIKTDFGRYKEEESDRPTNKNKEGRRAFARPRDRINWWEGILMLETVEFVYKMGNLGSRGR